MASLIPWPTLLDFLFSLQADPYQYGAVHLGAGALCRKGFKEPSEKIIPAFLEVSQQTQ
jgi:hypothetical protein